MSEGPRTRFQPKAPESYWSQDVNPYMMAHRTWGRPVVTAEEAQGLRGRWREEFGRAAPLHVEVGAGNGFHLAGMAARHPDRNWLGIEIRFKRVVMCARKLEIAGAADHARICRYDAWALDDLFEEGEIDSLYVFHPDPWSRRRDSEKRLMSVPWAGWICRAVRVGGVIRIKTDHRPHIEAFVAATSVLPLKILDRRDDVLADGYPWPVQDDVVTNYESKFHRRGIAVGALLVERVVGDAPHGTDMPQRGPSTPSFGL